MTSITHRTPILATDYACVGCFACVSSCPVQAINVEQHNDGHEYVRIDSNKCVGCLKCEKICASIQSMYGSNDLNESELFGGWSKDELQRSKGTSGGVFAAFAEHIIRRGGVVVGAYFDGRVCKHRIIHNVDEISMLQGSKYTPSSLLGMYEEIGLELKQHVVLFSGLGCQCAAVLAYFENFKWKDNLITLDLICGGVPSKVLMEKYFEANTRVNKIVSFRTKDKYELTIETDEGIVVDHNRPLPLYGFSCGMTNRLSCYDCQYAFAHRKTDITIGDLWDYDTLPDEHKNGVSMLIVHSERGKQLLIEANIEAKAIKWRGPLAHNKRLVCGKQRVFKYRKKLPDAIKEWSYSEFEKVYCLDVKKDPKLLAFKIFRKGMLIKDSRVNNRKVEQILSYKDEEQEAE